MSTTNLVLFDYNRDNLKPLSYTKPIAALRIGINTIKEKWELALHLRASHYTAPYLKSKYPLVLQDSNLLINASVLPSPVLNQYLLEHLPYNSLLVHNGTPLALRCNTSTALQFFEGKAASLDSIECAFPIIYIAYCWDLFRNNKEAIAFDFAERTKGRTSAPLHSSNSIIGDASQVFLEEGATAYCSIFNTQNGPIYLGKNSSVMEGCMIRGSLALCEGASLKMGTKLYGPTTVGPFSKIGGEVNNSIISGYSNKGHDGFLGNAVLGEWCNLGADTNNSNLKNNYAEIRQWNYSQKTFISTGLQFCGLIMGDHSKTGINSMFNTGTVVGVSTNIYGSDFPRTFIPSYSWGSSKGFATYQLDKAIETAQRVVERRQKVLDENDIAILKYIFEDSKNFRNY